MEKAGRGVRSYLAELFAPEDLRFTSIIVPTRDGVAAAILNQG